MRTECGAVFHQILLFVVSEDHIPLQNANVSLANEQGQDRLFP